MRSGIGEERKKQKIKIICLHGLESVGVELRDIVLGTSELN